MKPTLLNWTRETSNFRQNHRQSVTDTKIFSIWSVSFSTDRNSELIQQKENKMVHVGRWIKMKMKNKHSVPFTKVNDHCEETVRKCFHVVSVVQLSNCFLFPGWSVRVKQEAREDAVSVSCPSHRSVVFSLQPNLLIFWHVHRQATRSHLGSAEFKD